MSEASDSSVEAIRKRAGLEEDRVGSDRYKQNHMGLIFQDGLSFSGFERNKLFLGNGAGQFVDVSDLSGADSEMDCRAACRADFDNDGDVDLFVNSIQRDCHLLYRNNLEKEDRFFIKVVLQATKGHPAAIGAVVRLEGASMQTQVLTCGDGFESQHAEELVFATAGKSPRPVKVLWPGGGWESFSVRPGTFLLVQGSGQARALERPAFTLAAENKPRRGMGVGQLLPRLTFAGTRPTEFQAAGDKPVLINFWSTTCAPCLEELPDLARLSQQEKYRILLINMDPPTREGRMKELLARLAPQLTNRKLDRASLERLFGTSSTTLPTTIILEPDGRVRRVVRGALDFRNL